MTSLRIMILNYSNEKQLCPITFSGGTSVRFLTLSADTPDPEQPETLIDTKPSPYTLTVPPGGVCGFVAPADVSITNPAPGLVNIIAAAGKNDWPPPPLAPSQFTNCYDFHQRYLAFAGEGTGSNMTIEMKMKVVNVPGPPPAAPVGTHAKVHR